MNVEQTFIFTFVEQPLPIPPDWVKARSNEELPEELYSFWLQHKLQPFVAHLHRRHRPYTHAIIRGRKFERKQVCRWDLRLWTLDAAKPHIQYLARCQMARRATERALKHQGVIHKDIIPVIGKLVWESRWEDEWE